MEIRNNKGYGKLKTVIVCYPCNFKVKGKVQINYPLMYEPVSYTHLDVYKRQKYR